ncbi:succinate-semialdehyde dehydrogenase/glutarate-semialdehyde dehydrogenase [Virgibacillus natechei]|uniref:Succinate-semialdehyde dehydrogenase/glutarate-semialdehyde dehydrogenase n=1 Tax=Virgibacillus natechei TaxID=1216297 RepID=A0ABS4II43_9BACI|nr:NAD-dependent succinate-semialdehyde dehydrogenase [Virgibacillus natechei]MBP1970632.1 succinate-semialdehyde dehydrogenase/glutarate-semialdehyde dehydrogenase [Virgibacillus natechei]UZD13979.1 NAD-dependent succinate-semialdehyde dehydrogenase [Virgibacillus natechei]
MFDKQTKSIFIGGKWIDVQEKETIYNPTTLEPITEVAYGGAQETEIAIQAASKAFTVWSDMTGRQRSRVLYKASQLMLEEADRLGEILTLEQGKPLNEAIGEVKGAANFLLWYAEEASRGYGEWIPSSIKSKRMLVIPQPVGVVGAITPWNFPSSMVTRKIGPALAAGCTVVLKPAPETPLSAIEIIKIFDRAGMPEGVVNLVTGDAQAIGNALLLDKDVRLLTFTGSTAVGKYLMRESAEHVKKLSLELGGHAPSIVFDDADIDLATNLVLASKFRNNGQTCICTNRLYVHESIADQFTALLTEKVSQLKVGSGLEEDVDLGPLINQQALEKVQSHLKDAIEKGAQVVVGGGEWEGNLEGCFYNPSVLTNVSDDMLIMNEETFGPIIPIQTFRDEEEVLHKANDTDYGLAAYIFTESTNQAIRASEKLEFGIVGINDVFPAVAEAPFGGIKQSGNGKEGGHHGMDEFLEKKFVSIGIS